MKFAFIGCGKIAGKHLVSVNSVPGAMTVAVCDKNLSAARDFGTKHDLPFYEDPHVMLKKEQVDIISVLTPSGTHAQTILGLVDSGKHFVVEKPLALRLDDADKVIEACDRRGVNIFVVQQNRFNKPIRALRQAIDQGRLGRMVLGTVRVRWARHQKYYDQAPWRGTWAFDGGVFTNQASHHIDMLTWLMGDVESVMAKSDTRLLDIEVEDTGVAVLKFANGALGVIEATVATRPNDIEGSISILGEKGSVEIGGYHMNELKVWNFADSIDSDADVFEKSGRNPDAYAWNHTEYLKDVVESLIAKKKALIDGIEGRKSLELINAIYESIETGRDISLRFKPRKCKLGIGNNEQ